jgi:hypothetical protein
LSGTVYDGLSPRAALQGVLFACFDVADLNPDVSDELIPLRRC